MNDNTVTLLMLLAIITLIVAFLCVGMLFSLASQYPQKGIEILLSF